MADTKPDDKHKEWHHGRWKAGWHFPPKFWAIEKFLLFQKHLSKNATFVEKTHFKEI